MEKIGSYPPSEPYQDWQGEIERLGWGGKGLGRTDDGRIVLLDSTLAMFPGEVVKAAINLKAKHAEGVVSSIVSSNAERVEPACPVAQTCGACAMWGSGEKYSTLKRLMVDDLLHRQLPDAPPYTWHTSPEGTKRSRIQLHWDGKQLGYHAFRSNIVVPVDGCPMAADPLSAAIPALRNALVSGALPNTPERWELATGTPPEVVVATTASPEIHAWELVNGRWEVCTRTLTHELGGHEVAQLPGAFFQVCPQWAWEAFSQMLIRWDIQGEDLYDLYGGGGLFSLMLGDRFRRITLVESAQPSLAAARQNLAVLKGSGCAITIVNQKVEKWLPEDLGYSGSVILLDPPRSGLPTEVTRKLCTSQADAIVLVGCDGMSFCRDLKRLQSEWVLDKLAVVDLFPNTALAEFCGLLKPN